jgi:PAS domain S-box-containing protein
MPDDDAALRARVADAILDTASDAVIVCDRDGAICLWSAGAERIFGFTAEQALGRSLDIIIPERLQARHWDGFRKMMASGQSRYPQGHLLSAPGRRNDGAQVSVEFTAVALKDADGAVAHIVAIMRDVTARFEEIKALRRQLAGGAAEASGAVKT